MPAPPRQSRGAPKVAREPWRLSDGRYPCEARAPLFNDEASASQQPLAQRALRLSAATALASTAALAVVAAGGHTVGPFHRFRARANTGLFNASAAIAAAGVQLELAPVVEAVRELPPFMPRSWQEAIIKAQQVEAQLSASERVSLLHGVGILPQGSLWVGYVPGIPRLGIPELRMQDAGQGWRIINGIETGTVVQWPSLLTVASAWDEQLVREVASGIAEEFLAKGANVLLGPGLNVHRCAYGGRNWEYMSGEDPLLGARLAFAYVEAAQSRGIMCVAKHYAFNEQETDRFGVSSEVSKKVAWELYYPPFEAAVSAGVGAVMCSYNKVNGTQACDNDEILNRDLKGHMGFQGFVMSDWGAGMSSSSVERGADMEMPTASAFADVALAGSASEPAVRAAARRVLTAAFRLRLDERPGCFPCTDLRLANVRTESNLRLALQAATDGVVLLQNSGILPFDPAKVKKLAVLGYGATANDAHDGWNVGTLLAGGGSGHVSADKVATALPAIQERAAVAGIEVVAAVGPPDVPVDTDALIVVTGTTAGEGNDRTTLRLDPADEALINLAKSFKPTVVLLQVPGAMVIPWAPGTAAVACMFYGGEQTGRAWASVLFGDVAPSGRLPLAFPVSEEHAIRPSMTTAVYQEGLFTSYRSPTMKASFPFGHGLTYTVFEYGPPQQVLEGCGGRVCLRFDVYNRGSRSGREVVQVYANFPLAVGEPSIVLKGFHKTRLLYPGEREDVVVTISLRDLSAFDEATEVWVPHKEVVFLVAASSADVRHSIRLAL